jgi:hypothetical protein
MNVIGKECLHDCEADLSAACDQVISAMVKDCLDGAERREAYHRGHAGSPACFTDASACADHVT